MNKEIAARWTAALRSGEYKQGKNRLRRAGNEYCCLGVLCDISGLSKWEGDGVCSFHLYSGQATVTPDAVMVWAGMRDRNGICANGDLLTELNDSGKTFTEIADIIDANVEVL